MQVKLELGQQTPILHGSLWSRLQVPTMHCWAIPDELFLAELGPLKLSRSFEVNTLRRIQKFWRSRSEKGWNLEALPSSKFQKWQWPENHYINRQSPYSPWEKTWCFPRSIQRKFRLIFVPTQKRVPYSVWDSHKFLRRPLQQIIRGCLAFSIVPNIQNRSERPKRVGRVARKSTEALPSTFLQNWAAEEDPRVRIGEGRSWPEHSPSVWESVPDSFSLRLVRLLSHFCLHNFFPLSFPRFWVSGRKEPILHAIKLTCALKLLQSWIPSQTRFLIGLILSSPQKICLAPTTALTRLA